MKTKSGTVVSQHQAESGLRYLPLVDLLLDTKTELLELALRSGLTVFTTMLEEDRKLICGPRYAHEPDRRASRCGALSKDRTTQI
jgi:DNA-binding IclR family transcriptional regulator